MNNKEKKEYIDLKTIIGPYAFISELSKKSFVTNNTPKKLYKFRKFDEYTVDMIERNYVYLAKASTLDDPFDCLTYSDSIINFDSPRSEITSKVLNYLSKTLLDLLPFNKDVSQKDLKKIIKKSILDGRVDDCLVKKEVSKNKDLSEKEKRQIINVFNNFNNLSTEYKSDKNFEQQINYLLNAKQEFGICSLTTNRDNKVMWSLYGDLYKGYCIEYDIPINDAVMARIFPVIYKSKYDNSVYNAVFKTLFSHIKRQLTNGYENSGVATLIELLCTKDSDWSYQDEWRLIDKEGKKFHELPIKAIYLGFDISNQHENEIIKLSKVHNFSVYKMNKPNGFNIISYTLLSVSNYEELKIESSNKKR